MQFNSYTTSTLVKQKEDFEYTAQMCALERVAIPELVADEYLLVRQEIERRETLYRSNATRANLVEALAVVLTAMEQRTVAKLVDGLAQGAEFKDGSAEVRLNPKSGFFREILLRRRLDGNEDIVNAAILIPGGAFPVAWLWQTYQDLTESAAVEAGEPRIYKVLSLGGRQSSRIEFVSNSQAPDPNALVTEIRVTCW